MANPEHVALVRQGSKATAEWRRAHRRERLELSRADLLGAYAHGAELGGADLSEADLRMADLGASDLMVVDLSGADLSIANLANANLSGANLSGASLCWANLSGANLSRANLSGANLRGANLTKGDVSGADLSGGDLAAATLVRVNLTGARLSGADVMGSNLVDANLAGADLSGARLMLANFLHSEFSNADLSRARLGGTCLNDVDLSRVHGLMSVTHVFPSSIGADTLIATLRGAGNRLTPELAAFFRGAGVPQELLDALPGIVAEVRYYSCLICHGQPDVKLAKRLYEDLQAKGVSCWLCEMDKTAGEPIWGDIDEERREAEATVMLCSVEALAQGGVLKEIKEQVDANPDKLVPISVDNLWRERGFRVVQGARDLKPFLLERNCADFANRPYEEALEVLLRSLRRKVGLPAEAQAS